MEKDIYKKDFLSITEFARLVDVEASALRRYDNDNIFKPAKRGEGVMHEHRLYAPTQITTFKMLRVLTELGVDRDIIKALTHDRSPEKLLKLFTSQKDEIAECLRFFKDAYSVIDTFTSLLTTGICATEEKITVSTVPEWNIILGDITDFNGDDGFYREYMRFCEGIHEPKINLSYPVGGFFESMDVFLNEPSKPTRFFSADPKGHDQKNAGLYLIGYTRGYYGQTNGLPQRMAAYAKEKGLLFVGPVYNIYVFDEISIPDTNNYLLQVSASVKETGRANACIP